MRYPIYVIYIMLLGFLLVACEEDEEEEITPKMVTSCGEFPNFYATSIANNLTVIDGEGFPCQPPETNFPEMSLVPNDSSEATNVIYRGDTVTISFQGSPLVNDTAKGFYLYVQGAARHFEIPITEGTNQTEYQIRFFLSDTVDLGLFTITYAAFADVNTVGRRYSKRYDLRSRKTILSCQSSQDPAARTLSGFQSIPNSSVESCIIDPSAATDLANLEIVDSGTRSFFNAYPNLTFRLPIQEIVNQEVFGNAKGLYVWIDGSNQHYSVFFEKGQDGTVFYPIGSIPISFPAEGQLPTGNYRVRYALFDDINTIGNIVTKTFSYTDIDPMLDPNTNFSMTIENTGETSIVDGNPVIDSSLIATGQTLTVSSMALDSASYDTTTSVWTIIVNENPLNDLEPDPINQYQYQLENFTYINTAGSDSTMTVSFSIFEAVSGIRQNFSAVMSSNSALNKGSLTVEPIIENTTREIFTGKLSGVAVSDPSQFVPGFPEYLYKVRFSGVISTVDESELVQ